MKVVKIPKECIKELYYRNRRISFPKKSEYHKFSFFVGLDRINRTENDGAEIILNKNVTAKYNNKNIVFTVEQIEQIYNGVDVQPVKEFLTNKDVVLEKKLNYLSERLPQEMIDMPNWVVFRTKINEQKGRLDKILISPITHEWAKANDSSTWADFETAKQFAIENNFKGLSFALDKGITCIDLDDSIKDGKFSKLAEKFIENIPSTFTEISTSGKGLHIFVKDDILQGDKFRNRVKIDDGEVEVYDTARFISMSGNSFNNINDLSKVSDNFKKEIQKMLGKKAIQIDNRQTRISMNDQEIINRISKSKKGKEFDELMRGISLSGDRSRDDMKLLNMLAFFTDCNKGQMESIFKSSGLYRAEKGQAYIKLSIDKAVSTLTSRIRAENCKVKKNNFQYEKD